MKFNKALASLLTGKDLTAAEAYQAFHSLFKGEVDLTRAKSLLLSLALKGETADEVFGCLRAIRQFEPAQELRIPHLLDTCGTGGDQSHTFNISTLTAFVIAGAGGKVVKHGNRAISSNCGSSDLMEALGINLQAPRKRMIEAVRKAGIGYFHAPLYHPVFLRFQPLRRSLKTRTVFNLLGPLLNPFILRYQLVGVAKKDYLKLYSALFAKMGIRKVLVVCSADGMDEISASGKTYAAWVDRKKIRFSILSPSSFGRHVKSSGTLKGGSVKQNKLTALKFLQGQIKGLLRQTVLVNAAAGLVACDIAKTLSEGFSQAEKSLDSGRAYRSYKQLKEISQRK